MKLIILDRDGVINEDSDAYIKTLDEWIPIPGSIGAIARLSKAGWTVAVATNQSGVGRGYYSEATLHSMHERLCALVAEQGGKVDLIRYCPHTPDAGCDCRKPAPGLYHQIAESLQIGLAGVPLLVRTGKGESTQHKPLPEGTLIFDNLAAVADHLLEA
jgi:D-glycero-D-manno-heptose 1,7-bisphosphate phosphatase